MCEYENWFVIAISAFAFVFSLPSPHFASPSKEALHCPSPAGEKFFKGIYHCLSLLHFDLCVSQVKSQVNCTKISPRLVLFLSPNDVWMNGDRLVFLKRVIVLGSNRLNARWPCLKSNPASIYMHVCFEYFVCIPIVRDLECFNYREITYILLNSNVLYIKQIRAIVKFLTLTQLTTLYIINTHHPGFEKKI